MIARREGEERFRAELERKLRALDPAAFIALAPLVARHEPIVASLGEIRCPTTVLVGEHDAPFLPRAEELAAGIADARLVRIPGAGHSPQRSGREAWLAAVREHLASARGA